MFSLCVFVVLYITIQSGFIQARNENCANVAYITIDDARRSTANNRTTTEICDRSIIEDDVWYRFSSEAGEKIPTTMPKAGRCGTVVPIWMQGVHPTVGEGTVGRKACAHVPHQSPIGCAYSYNIKVRNCSGFYIYQLKRPLHCVFAYCTGSKLPNCTNSDTEEYCLENRPPFFSMPHRLYAFENSKLQLVLNATDPEGYPITYSYLPNKTVGHVSIDTQKKVVEISVKHSGKVSLKVEDPEKVQTIHTIEFVSIPCGCQNEGKCFNENNKNFAETQAELSNYTCNCVKSYTGKLCEISPCDDLPCYPGLKCSVTTNSYECETCPTSFAGDGMQCQLILTKGTVLVAATLSIHSGLEWTDDLLNNTSHFYRETTDKIVTEIKRAYGNTKEFLYVIVYGYRKGSVVVEFQLALNETLDKPLKPLITRVQREEKLGNFGIRAQSVKKEETSDVEGELRVLSGLNWKDDLLNKSSSYYRDINRKLTTELNKVYADEKEFLSAFVTGFRKLQFVVEFKLVFRKKINAPLDKLKNETNGTLGKVKIDDKSVKVKIDDKTVKVKTTTPSPKDQTYFGLHKTIFIVVVCLVSILALVSILVCGICIRKKHISIIMLSVDEDNREIYPTSNNSEFPMRRSSPNQVMDISDTHKKHGDL